MTEEKPKFVEVDLTLLSKPQLIRLVNELVRLAEERERRLGGVNLERVNAIVTREVALDIIHNIRDKLHDWYCATTRDSLKASDTLDSIRNIVQGH